MFSPSCLLLAMVSAMTAFLAQTNGQGTQAVCGIQDHLLSCQYIEQATVSVIQTNLANIKSKYPSFGVSIVYSVLEDLPDDIFVNYTTSSLVLTHSILETFPSNFLYYVSPDTASIDASHNFISSMAIDKFKYLPCKDTLSSLLLNNNAITTVESYSFSDFPNLQEISLAYNVITAVSKYAFVQLNNLRSLDLSNNKIEVLGEEAFLNLPALTTLDLSFNQISVVGRNSFTGLTSLAMLNFDANSIHVLEDNTFNNFNLPKLQEITFGGNPFNCDCALQWLKDWLISDGLLDYTYATCRTPRFAAFNDTNFC